MQPFRTKSTVSNVEIGRTEKKEEDEQFGSLATFQFSTSAILFSEFDTVLLVTEQPKRKVRGL